LVGTADRERLNGASEGTVTRVDRQAGRSGVGAQPSV